MGKEGASCGAFGSLCGCLCLACYARLCFAVWVYAMVRFAGFVREEPILVLTAVGSS